MNWIEVEIQGHNPFRIPVNSEEESRFLTDELRNMSLDFLRTGNLSLREARRRLERSIQNIRDEFYRRNPSFPQPPIHVLGLPVTWTYNQEGVVRTEGSFRQVTVVRPPGLTEEEWNGFASQVCSLFTQEGVR